jgi:hypothetical protein
MLQSPVKITLQVAGDHAVEVLRLVDVAEEAAGVVGVLALGPHATAMAEAHVLVLGRDGQHVRVEVAEAGGDEQRGTVLRDHALHGLLHGLRLGHVFFFDHLDAGHLLQLGRGFGVRLVVAEIVPGADVDDAHAHGLLGEGPGAQARQRQGGQLGQGTAAGSNVCHLGSCLGRVWYTSRYPAPCSKSRAEINPSWRGPRAASPG